MKHFYEIYLKYSPKDGESIFLSSEDKMDEQETINFAFDNTFFVEYIKEISESEYKAGIF